MSGGIDGVEARFGEGSLVAGGGLLLAVAVTARLGLEALIDDTVRPAGSAGSGSGRKVLALVASMLVGGSCIDDTDRLRAGSAGAVSGFAVSGFAVSGFAVSGFAVSAPSALGSFLRSFALGHVRQLDRAHELALQRAWSVGAAPAAAEMTVDLDSTICEVFGKAKHGAAYGHTRVMGCHPLAAVRDDTGEMLHSPMRSGSSQRGNEHFARETLARLRRLAADASVTVRADAGFFSYDMIDALGAHGASYSITIPHNAKAKAAVDAIDDDACKATPCACPLTGPGRAPIPQHCNACATSPCSSEPPAAPGAAQPHPTRHQPAPAPHTSLARPKTRRPAHPHQPCGQPAPTVDPTNPSVDPGLVCRQ